MFGFKGKSTPEIREELKKKLDGVMHLPENKKAREILEARVAAIDAYDSKLPKAKNEKVRLESRKERIAALSAELIESNEVFSFPGIDPEAYKKLTADIEGDKDKSLYDISSPDIDELIERFKNEGMRVTLGDTPKAGNVYIIPAGSENYNQPPGILTGISNMVIQSVSLFPRQLQASGIREKLEELVLLRRQVRSFEPRG